MYTYFHDWAYFVKHFNIAFVGFVVKLTPLKTSNKGAKLSKPLHFKCITAVEKNVAMDTHS